MKSFQSFQRTHLCVTLYVLGYYFDALIFDEQTDEEDYKEQNEDIKNDKKFKNSKGK